MAESPPFRKSARDHLQELVGSEIRTVTGRPNRVLRIEGEAVLVATQRSPRGKRVPIRWVQDAMDILERDGKVDVGVRTLGYRSAFVGAVLLTLPGARALPTRPARIEIRG